MDKLRKTEIIRKAMSQFLEQKVFSLGYVPKSIKITKGIPVVIINDGEVDFSVSLLISFLGEYITTLDEYKKVEDVLELVKGSNSTNDLFRVVSFITVDEAETEEPKDYWKTMA